MQNCTKLIQDLNFSSAEFIIVVPPFVKIGLPSYAAHLLQAIANHNGINTKVFYANLLLNQKLGQDQYDALTIGNVGHPLLGDLVFYELAYGNKATKAADAENKNIAPHHKRLAYTNQSLSIKNPEDLEPLLNDWLEETTQLISDVNPTVVGLTSMFDQNNASIAILNRLKALSPEITTIIGGANCEGPLARGISSLSTKIDYIFSGESDFTLIPSLKRIIKGEKLDSQIINGSPIMDLDSHPTPDFSDYLHQWDIFQKDKPKSNPLISYETSRGCWWGEKHHCTFCGLNGEGMTYRKKNPDKILHDLKKISTKHDIKNVLMVDNIMPMHFFKDLLPDLQIHIPGINIFYEQKANLNLDKLIKLKKAGISTIQPGVESFSSHLLKLMDKGISGSLNLHLLRNAGSIGLSLSWNLIYAFPGDKLDDYIPTMELVPHLVHLQPPLGLHHLSLDRFSMYHMHPSKYGIDNLRPLEAYFDVYPEWADVENLAYYFSGEYQSESKEDTQYIKKFDKQVRDWQKLWKNDSKPELHLRKLSEKTFCLIDSRNDISKPTTSFLDYKQAKGICKLTKDKNSEFIELAVENNWGVIWDDGHYVPLMTFDEDILHLIQ